MSDPRTYYHRLTDPENGPVGPPSERALVSSVRVEQGPGHDFVHVWNRGGKSGTLVVTRGDGETVATLLLPPHERLDWDLWSDGGILSDLTTLREAITTGELDRTMTGPDELNQRGVDLIVALSRAHRALGWLLEQRPPVPA